MNHEDDSLTCWCGPDVYQLCPECGGEEQGCWHCLPDHPGLVRVPDYELEVEPDHHVPWIIVHQDTAG